MKQKKSFIDISVIIPIYGAEQYIEQSLRSVFGQSKTQGVEFILVNDCTPDRSMEVVDRLICEYRDLDIHVIHHEQNRGVSVARQTGISQAQGTYLAFVDADDYCDANFLQQLFELAEGTQADLVVCDFVRDEAGSFHPMIEPVPEDNVALATGILSNRVHPMLWNKLIKRSILERYEIQFVEGINIGEDLILLLKVLCYVRKIAYLPKTLYYYRFVASSITTLFAQDKLLDIELYLKNIEEFYRDRGFYHQYEQPLITKKIIEKSSLMKHTQGSQRRKYAQYYPEVTPYILSNTTLSKHLRWFLYLATKGFLGPYNLLMTYRKLRAKL